MACIGNSATRKRVGSIGGASHTKGASAPGRSMSSLAAKGGDALLSFVLKQIFNINI